jgi:anthranilate phosphoribosyltransferase
VALTLAALGVANALVVHGAGLDEIALHGETEAVRLREGVMERLTIVPEDAGFERRPVEMLKGGGPEENAERLRALLMGYALAAEAEVVALNAGALLMAAGLASSLRDGAAMALDAIRSGAAHRRLKMLIEATND